MEIALSLPSWSASESRDPGQKIGVVKDDPLYGEGITLVADDGFETTTLLLTAEEALRVAGLLSDVARA